MKQLEVKPVKLKKLTMKKKEIPVQLCLEKLPISSYSKEQVRYLEFIFIYIIIYFIGFFTIPDR